MDNKTAYYSGIVYPHPCYCQQFHKVYSVDMELVKYTTRIPRSLKLKLEREVERRKKRGDKVTLQSLTIEKLSI